MTAGPVGGRSQGKSELFEEVVRIMLLRLPTPKSSGPSYEEGVIALAVH